MKSFFKNILKVSASNIVSLLSGVVTGFLLPKMMGLEGYANYKIYTLYLTYIALTSLGLGDGLYLQYAGIDRDKLDKNQIKYYLRKYYFQLLLIFFIAVSVSLFVVPDENRFVCIALSLTILSSQIIAVHQNLSVITSRFNEYSTRLIIKAVITTLFVAILFGEFLIKKTEISYQIYIVGIVLVDFILAIWYIFTYNDFNFGRIDSEKLHGIKYTSLLCLGFPLLISNMAGSIFLNFDRQFVSVLFAKTDYAIYAFAYNLLTLITTMTSAVSIVLFPALRKIKGIDIKNELLKYSKTFNIIVALCLSVYFVLCWIVGAFLPKYIKSIEVLRVVLPGLIFSSSVTVVLNNFYKLENKIKIYFLGTLSALIVAIGFNFLAYHIWKSYISISWISLLALVYWYFVSYLYFVKKYHVPVLKNFIYLVTVCVAFYLITGFVTNIALGMIIYLMAYGCITILFNKNIFDEVKNVLIKRD